VGYVGQARRALSALAYSVSGVAPGISAALQSTGP